MEGCRVENLLLSVVPCSEQEGCLDLKNNRLEGFTEGLLEELEKKSPEFIQQIIAGLEKSPCRARNTIITIAQQVLKNKK